MSWQAGAQQLAFIEQIRKNKPITITNPEMTRFMSFNAAVELVLFAFEKGKNGYLFWKSHQPYALLNQ